MGEPRVIAGRYELGERIGVGASAFVYAAVDRETGREVALKLLLPAFAGDPEFVTRFRREAQAASSLDHPNIVRVLDWDADGDAYLVMELMRGGDLHARLARGPLDVAESIHIAIRVADALEAAHARGIVHRDLKPQNILLDEHDDPKLADFGVARALWLTQITRTNLIFGSPHYLSPEQARGAHVDERADIYGLGVVLYEMLTGRTPFVAESPVAIALKHVHERPPAPRAIRSEIPRRLEAIVLRALAKDPRERYQSARELRAALAAALPATQRIGAPTRRRVALLVPVGLLAALVAGTAAIAAPMLRELMPDRPQLAAIPPDAPAAAASASIAVPLSATLSTPAPTPEPTATPTPAATPAATETPAPTAAQTPAPASPAPVAVAPRGATQVVKSGAIDAIARFYQLISARDLDGALGLWDARMRTTYPPASALYQRFASTSYIGLNGATVASQTDTTAKVAVDITEINSGTRRRWVGYWYLVRGPNGWLLDQPALVGG